MGIQQDADTVDYPAVVNGGASMAIPSPTGPGGNMCLVNQDEAEIIEASYEHTAVQQVGFPENTSSVSPMFREQAL